MLNKLVKIANRLDDLGLTKEADVIDGVISKIAGDVLDPKYYGSTTIPTHPDPKRWEKPADPKWLEYTESAPRGKEVFVKWMDLTKNSKELQEFSAFTKFYNWLKELTKVPYISPETFVSIVSDKEINDFKSWLAKPRPGVTKLGPPSSTEAPKGAAGLPGRDFEEMKKKISELRPRLSNLHLDIRFSNGKEAIDLMMDQAAKKGIDIMKLKDEELRKLFDEISPGPEEDENAVWQTIPGPGKNPQGWVNTPPVQGWTYEEVKK